MSEERNSLHVCHPLALLFQFCLILKMMHLTGIKQEFQAKWIEVRIGLACQLPRAVGSYVHDSAAAIPYHSQRSVFPAIPPSPAPPCSSNIQKWEKAPK